MADAFSLKVKNPGKLFANLKKRDRLYLRDVRRALAVSGDEFIQIIQSSWYSGRNQDDTGLNRITSRLHNAWRANVTGRGFNDVSVSITNGTPYVEFHEFRGGRHKKRTFVTQDLKGSVGRRIFVTGLRKALKKNF